MECVSIGHITVLTGTCLLLPVRYMQADKALHVPPTPCPLSIERGQMEHRYKDIRNIVIESELIVSLVI